MRVVLDTNVVASAVLWGGTPERLFELAGEAALELFTSEALLTELARILGRAKFGARLRLKNIPASEIVAQYRALCDVVEPAMVDESSLRDPDDSSVLACAIAAGADVIVTGDADLRTLGSYRGIIILSPSEYVERFKA